MENQRTEQMRNWVGHSSVFPRHRTNSQDRQQNKEPTTFATSLTPATSTTATDLPIQESASPSLNSASASSAQQPVQPPTQLTAMPVSELNSLSHPALGSQKEPATVTGLQSTAGSSTTPDPDSRLGQETTNGSWKMVYNKNTLSARNFCAKDWCLENKGGTIAQFQFYWESLLPAERAKYEVMSKDAKIAKKNYVPYDIESSLFQPVVASTSVVPSA
ncbi:hypothetical protein ARMSODRAFT_1009938 [Armillaria solidipes]|uniref:Uncharacterized protein n=1 Tax=Armillaria solidipes TaxID=1076256 RepID=A0A2H3B7J7_9AGAR|nr:hypothetical protein ARMSODRAFT_1009938 [Armillaria solidipes]